MSSAHRAVLRNDYSMCRHLISLKKNKWDKCFQKISPLTKHLIEKVHFFKKTPLRFAVGASNVKNAALVYMAKRSAEVLTALFWCLPRQKTELTVSVVKLLKGNYTCPPRDVVHLDFISAPRRAGHQTRCYPCSSATNTPVLFVKGKRHRQLILLSKR